VAEVDAWFIKDYQSSVFLAYQRQMSLLGDTLRKGTVNGLTAVVPKYGTAVAGRKDRHGLVPVTTPDHSQVEWNVEDFYAGQWVDKLDLLKTNADERAQAASAGGYALARKKDELIVNAIRASLPAGQRITAAGGMTFDKAMAAKEQMENADVPDDGMTVCVIGPHQWSELGKYREFASADYVDDKIYPGRRLRRRTWQGITWINAGSLLAGFKAGNIRPCLMYHMSAMAWGEGADVATDITWHGDRQAWFFAHTMSGNAKRIEDTGVIEISCDDTTALPAST